MNYMVEKQLEGLSVHIFEALLLFSHVINRYRN
jgi:hypothetical protein